MDQALNGETENPMIIGVGLTAQWLHVLTKSDGGRGWRDDTAF